MQGKNRPRSVPAPPDVTEFVCLLRECLGTRHVARLLDIARSSVDAIADGRCVQRATLEVAIGRLLDSMESSARLAAEAGDPTVLADVKMAQAAFKRRAEVRA